MNHSKYFSKPGIQGPPCRAVNTAPPLPNNAPVDSVNRANRRSLEKGEKAAELCFPAHFLSLIKRDRVSVERNGTVSEMCSGAQKAGRAMETQGWDEKRQTLKSTMAITNQQLYLIKC